MKQSDVVAEETEERLRKTKLIVLTGPRDRTHGTLGRATGRSTRVVRRQKRGVRGALRPWPFMGVSGGR